MSYPTVTINRTSKLEKPAGIGQGRVSEGTIAGAFRTFNDFPAGSFGLRSVRSIFLTPGTYYRAGTPVVFMTNAQVNNAGSPNNTVSISCRQMIADTIRIGSARYTTISPAFAATVGLVVKVCPGTPQSPGAGTAPLGTTDGLVGGTPYAWWIVDSVDAGSFQTRGTPTTTGYYEALGPGSLTLMFTAFGP